MRAIKTNSLVPTHQPNCPKCPKSSLARLTRLISLSTLISWTISLSRGLSKCSTLIPSNPSNSIHYSRITRFSLTTQCAEGAHEVAVSSHRSTTRTLIRCNLRIITAGLAKCQSRTYSRCHRSNPTPRGSLMRKKTSMLLRWLLRSRIESRPCSASLTKSMPLTNSRTSLRSSLWRRTRCQRSNNRKESRVGGTLRMPWYLTKRSIKRQCA